MSKKAPNYLDSFGKLRKVITQLIKIFDHLTLNTILQSSTPLNPLNITD